MKLKIKGKLLYRAHGVGKYRTKHLYLYLPQTISKKEIKRFFPNLYTGQDYATTSIVAEIRLSEEARKG